MLIKKSINFFRLKTGEVLFVTPKAGSRFITADDDDHAGNGHMSTSGSSASLASISSAKSSNNTAAVASVNIEVSLHILPRTFEIF